MTDPTSAQQPASGAEPEEPARGDRERVVVVTEGGMGVHDPEQDKAPADLIEQPAKVMRIGSMVKQLLEEVRNQPLDDKGRARLAEVHRRSIRELEDGLAPELVEELERISLPFTEDSPSDAELRIAQAQLVGWLRGCSTASRRHCSPSRWPRSSSCSRCGGPCPAPSCPGNPVSRVGPVRRVSRVCPVSRASPVSPGSAAPATAAPPANTSDPPARVRERRRTRPRTPLNVPENCVSR